MKIRPLQDRVLVKRLEGEEKTKGGIIIPDAAKEKPIMGKIVAAGKGTKYLPDFHASTDVTVWDYYGITAERAAEGGMNAKMFNSFLDGTKSGIEMASVANACGLDCPGDGLSFPPVGTHQLAAILKPKADGGMLEHRGMVEVISCLNRDGTDVERKRRQ